MRINTNQYSLNISNYQQENKNHSNKLKYAEFFAGGLGCASAAKKHPNIEVLWVLNHDKIACKTAYFHLTNTKVYWADIYMQDEQELEPVDIIQASFECDFHSPAIGSARIDQKSYMMGWELYRYIKFLMPLVLTVENVPGVKKWAPLGEDGQPDKSRSGEEFERWKNAMIDLGYNYTESIRCAADDGIPTSRTRYFAIFSKEGIDVSWPEPTHNEFGTDGKLTHVPCKNFIDLENVGNSIFGRQFNEKLPKQHRKVLSPKSLCRIGAGIKKYVPNFEQFISTYYGGEAGKSRGQSLAKPLKTQTCENRHQLITIEKMQFIADYCHQDFFQTPEDPLRPQLCRQTKQLITVDQFITQYYGTIQTQSLENSLNTIPCRDIHQLVTIEKIQFICEYYGGFGNPISTVKSLDKPLTPILSEPKHQLVTFLSEFDVKARFLTSEELAEISTFPRDFFNRDGLKLSHKNAIKLIGNAVPPEWFYKILSHNIEPILDYKLKRKSA
jgi:DNA (cytosine-5)-methyltransferase 1